MKRAGYTLQPTKLPGVYRLEAGGFFVRGTVKDPKTGRKREVSRVFPSSETNTLDASYQWLRDELQRLRTGESAQATRLRFSDFAVSLLERKLAQGDIWSPKGLEKWRYTLAHHLIPHFGDMFVDAITRDDVDAWCLLANQKVQTGKIAAGSANTHLSILKQILPDATDGVRSFRTPPGRETYSFEHPNAIAPSDVPRFLATMGEIYPQHFAMTLLGFTTGLRPSSLRPLRRKGPVADIRWSDGLLLVRRSQTRGDAVSRTKTGLVQVIKLPKGIVDVLSWHVEGLSPIQVKTDLLFPSDVGGYRAPSVLDKPFAAVGTAIGLPYAVTPRAMRRTFQDLGRAAGMAPTVIRSISGHTTEAMMERYSTIWGHEQDAGLTKVLALLGA